uniref:IS4 family transposase n=1 Tax=Polaromonas sp. TaxID=1869339 RepID=UPI001598E5C1|nr:IS4 family transposase [Polaromonas sp.]QJS06394.1 transposase [Polaromonas sp.]
MGWAEQEFETIDLGDPRLNRRAVLLAERLGQKPGASIPGACENWAETAAAYRFLRNEQVSCENVMAAHRQATMVRIREHAVVLCLQDTTELDYNGQAMMGLGPLSYEAQRGLYLHPTYVVTPEREPLGVMNAWTWAREFKQGDAPRGGVLESVRWVESYERIAEQAGEVPGTRHVCIGDRESDILALLLMARKMHHAADYLVRCQHNRVLPEGGKLWDEVMASVPLGRIRFEMPAGRGRKARAVEQEVRAQRVLLPDRQGGEFEVTCLIASEVNAPAGAKPVVWRLLTNRVASTLQDAVELVNWYRARWEIELFFLVLKEGCRVERLQLADTERLQTALALYMVIAWRINCLMRLGRTLPDLPADLVFEPDEWRAAFILNKKPVPKQTPTLNTVVRLIAQRGGFLGKKHDDEPGAKTIWLGMQEIAVFVEGARYARQFNDG